MSEGGEYRSSFARNLHERTDKPVFTTDDAVNQLRANDPSRTAVESAMDEFFMTHLPQEIINEAGGYQNNELDEDNIRRHKRAELQKTKVHQTHTQLTEGPPRRQTDTEKKPQRQKSDLTLAFMDSSDHVAKLARKTEMGEKFDKMRIQARSNEAPKVVQNPDRRHSGFVGAGPEEVVETAKPQRRGTHNPRKTGTMTADAFKKKYSKDGVLDGVKLLAESGFGSGRMTNPPLRVSNSEGSSDEDEGVNPVVVDVARPKGKDEDENENGEEWDM